MEDGVGARTVRQLVHDHYQVVYRFAYRLSGASQDAEDLTQQAFTAACRKLHQLQDPEKVRSWLFTIVRNAYCKSLDPRSRPFSTLEQDPDPPDENGANHFPEHFDEERLQEALNELPESYRTPLLLFFFDDLSYKEIAHQLNVPIGTVMSRLARAKSFLRERLRTEQVFPLDDTSRGANRSSG